jgi:DNA-directed RNA polymerase specialized sigma24 family protein
VRVVAHSMTGDEREVVGEAFGRHYPALLRFCVLLSGSQESGEDLAQEAFLRSARKIPLLGDHALPAYLRKAALQNVSQ